VENVENHFENLKKRTHVQIFNSTRVTRIETYFEELSWCWHQETHREHSALYLSLVRDISLKKLVTMF